MPDFETELQQVLAGVKQGLPPLPGPPKVEFEEQSVVGALPAAVGEEVVEFLRDTIDIPRRLLSVIERQPEAIAATRSTLQRFKVLQRTGLTPKQAQAQITQEFKEGKLPELAGNPEEAAAMLDIIALALPVGRVGGRVALPAGRKVFEKFAGTRVAGFLAERGISLPGLVEETIRSGAVGAKLGAVVPPRELAGEPRERAKVAALTGSVSALFPGLGAGVRASGVSEAVARAAERVRTKLGGPPADDLALARVAREELRAILRAKPIQEALQGEGTELALSVRAVVTELDDFGRIALEEAPSIVRTGTLGEAAKPISRELGRGLEREILERRFRRLLGERAPAVAAQQVGRLSTTAVSPQRVRSLNRAIIVLAEQVQEFAVDAASRAGNAATVEQAQVLARLLNAAGRQRSRFARAFGLSGRAFQEPANAQSKAEARAAVETLSNYLRQVGVGLEGLPALESGPAKTLFREGLNALRERNVGRSARIFTLDLWRRAIFPWFSFLADLPSDIGTLAEKGQREAVSDILDFVRTGTRGQRTRGSLDAIRYWRQFPKAELERVLGGDPALGERFRPFFGPKADIAAFTGLELKKVVDGTAQAFAFKSTLFGQAHKEAVERGLRGVERQNYVRARVQDILRDPKAVEAALEEGQRAAFRLPLPKAVERFTSNPFTILFLSPFGRFAIQWVRFLAEFTPASPTFAKKVLTGQASADDAVAFALRNAEGAGFVHLVNEVFYDEVDFDRFEYVFKDEKGNAVRRKSLRGIPFLAEGLFLSALLRGDWEKSLQALGSTSITFLSSPGIATKLVQAAMDLMDGKGSARTLQLRMEEFVSGFVPQRTLLGIFEQLLSPEERETGFRDIPGLSQAGRVRIDPFTGKPKRTRRFVSGTNIPAPAALGSRILSTELAPAEEFLRSAGITETRAPRIRTRGADKPSDTPAKAQEQFERIWGELHGRLVRSLARRFPSERLDSPEKKEALRELYQRQRALITQIAKAKLQAQGVRLAKD